MRTLLQSGVRPKSAHPVKVGFEYLILLNILFICYIERPFCRILVYLCPFLLMSTLIYCNIEVFILDFLILANKHMIALLTNQLFLIFHWHVS